MLTITNKLVRGLTLGIRDVFLWSRTRRFTALGDEAPVRFSRLPAAPSIVFAEIMLYRSRGARWDALKRAPT
jgi:hypothetical protein